MRMDARQLLRSLVATAERAVYQTEEELVRLKERLEQQRSHRGELQALVEAFKAEDEASQSSVHESKEGDRG